MSEINYSILSLNFILVKDSVSHSYVLIVTLNLWNP